MSKYRKGVGIFLLNQFNKLWVGKRIDFKNNYWQMPQGGIDEGETPKQAMVRELAEEVGDEDKHDNDDNYNGDGNADDGSDAGGEEEGDEMYLEQKR